MPRNSTPDWQRAIVTLSATIMGVIVVGALYWAQVVFIPIGLALFMTFVLTPVVRSLERRGLGRVLAVILVVLGASLLVGGSLWVVGQQVTGLLDDLPNYTSNIRDKIKSIKNAGAGSSRLGQMIREVNEEIAGPARKGEREIELAEGLDLTDRTVGDSISEETPTPVVVRPDTPGWLSAIPGYIGSVAESLASFALALVLVLFMLVNREDLRNRFLRLVGDGRMSSTTRAVDDAAHRISRFLLMQVVVNATYGAALAAGLLLIGVEYALLWGILAAALRYIPYAGAWIAAAFPVLVSTAMSQSWWEPVLVIGLVLVLELLSNNVMEPLLYGQSMGVSSVAQLVSVAFWAFLWGPIGLVLSAPLTVVLLVLGKHVRQLAFLDVLLGDEPPLEPEAIYYQRLLAHDQDEAAELALAASRGSDAEQVFDNLLIPALNFARRDLERGALSELDHQSVLHATAETLDDLGERLTVHAPSEEDSPATKPPRRVRVLACPSRDETDRLGLLMLQQLLEPEKWDVEVAAVETLTSELVAKVAQERRTIVCIGSVPPGGLAHTRYLCKRLRSRLPKIRIVVGRWGLRGNLDSNREQIEEAGADLVGFTLLETRKQMESWLSVLAQEEVRAAG